MHCYRISQVAEWRACSPKHQSEHSGHHRWAADLRVFNGAFVTTRKENICDRRITSGKSNATLLKPILRIIIPVQSMLIRNSWFSWELAIVKEVSPRGFSPEGLGNVGLSFFYGIALLWHRENAGRGCIGMMIISLHIVSLDTRKLFSMWLWGWKGTGRWSRSQSGVFDRFESYADSISVPNREGETP